ncbi:MAG TPA: M20/M25/M40 family metallo-hydrolase [Streptosporangiaceae bacterium]|nr:M20/M25/M40 family metallo-hydrolase [Streptosporangiaceae bacterium]
MQSPIAQPGLVAEFTARLPAMLDELGELVRRESPSGDFTALERSAEAVAALGQRLTGCAPEVIADAGPTHLRWTFGTGPRRVLLVGHHDTVWPLGSLEHHPWSVADGVARGPGCLDMKAGLVQMFHALSALEDTDGVTVLVNGDEEVGSRTSSGLIEDAARQSPAALVLEMATDDGALKTARKGVSMYEMVVKGRAAHAGLEPERGINASIEAAHLVLAIAELGDPGLGTTVTPTVLRSGTAANVVPARAALAVDVRASSAAEQQRVDAALRQVTPVLPGAEVVAEPGPVCRPMEPAASAGLFAAAQRLAGQLGLKPLRGAAVGGASDGNRTAGVGTPTLDGLGAVGGGPHADHEHVDTAVMPQRTALLAALVAELLRAGGGSE